jgi:hypothetical protein
VVAHIAAVDRDSVVHLPGRFPFLLAALVGILVRILYRHPVAAGWLASWPSFGSSANVLLARCMHLSVEELLPL